MQTKAGTGLYDYWTRRRGNRPVPLRAEIEPADIAPILPDLFILEHSATSDPRFRLTGTRFCAQFGREMKGMSFDAIFAPDERNRVARVVENVMAHCAPAVMHVDCVDGGLDVTQAEIVLLPLATSGTRVDRVIGAFAPLPRQNPPLSAFRYATFRSLGIIDTTRASEAAGNRPAVEMPASVMAVRAAGLGQTVRRVLHLRIFDGGRQNGGDAIR